MSLTDVIEIPRRTMVLFFVIDTSGSMDGSKLGAVNTAIEEVLPEIESISNENADALIKIAALKFSNGAEWITPNGPVELPWRWNDLQADGVTDFGEACKALNEKLSTKGFMKEATGSYAPAIFLLSDGAPTDNWKQGLEILKQNNWFKAAIKVAVAIGDDADKDVLKEFTSTMEAVLEVHNAKALKKMIKFVSVHASKVASKSSSAGSAGDEQKQNEMNACIKEIGEEIAASPDNDQAEW